MLPVTVTSGTTFRNTVEAGPHRLTADEPAQFIRHRVRLFLVVEGRRAVAACHRHVQVTALARHLLRNEPRDKCVKRRSKEPLA